MRRTSCKECTNRRHCIVSNIPPGELDEIQAAGATVVFKPRQVIFSEGTPIAGLYQVCWGAVKLYHSDHSGRDHILRIVGPGTMLGELPRDPRQTFSISAEAVAETQLLFLVRHAIEGFLGRYPTTALPIIAALSDELAASHGKVRDLALKGAESRLAGLLRDFAENDGPLSSGKRIQLGHSRRDLAEMIGVSTETAIRLLGQLRRTGAIEVNRRELVVLDAEKLMRIAAYPALDRQHAA